MQHERVIEVEGMSIRQQGQSDNQLRMQQPPLHRQCPRCNSNNTKFCYYNNYSLSQPRYFCKTCRRYWTHGGTLRNVPVGGNPKRGKRSRNSNTNSQPPPPPAQPNVICVTPLSSNEELRGLTASQSKRTSSDYKDEGDYMSTLTTMQAVNQPQGINNIIPTLNFGGDGLLREFNIPQIQAAQFYHMGNKVQTFNSVYPSASHEGFIQAGNNMINGSSQLDWRQGFIENGTSAWSINNTSTVANNNNNNNANDTTPCGLSSFGHIHHLSDIPGFSP